MDQLAKIEAPAYVGLRFLSGFMFACHGLQKLFGVLTTKPAVALFTQAWWGGVIELVAGALIAVGFLTRPAAFLAAGTMAVAFFQFHLKSDFAAWHFLPIMNGGETAVLYCWVFLFIAGKGPGRWSIDR